MATSIVLADDHTLFRQGVRQLLEQEPTLRIAGEADNGREAAELARTQRADLLIIDVVMPERNGIETVRQLLKQDGLIRALMLSSSTDARHVCEALEAGASGYITKDGDVAHLVEAIKVVMTGQSYLSPRVADVIVHSYVRGGSSHESTTRSNGNGNGNGRNRANGDASAPRRPDGARSLTPREREVLQMLSEGFASKEIAAELSVSVKTIDTHRAALMRKLELKSIAHLTKFAIREGITTLDF